MPTKQEAAVYGVLGADVGKRWKDCLRDYVEKSIHKRALKLLGQPPFSIPADWDLLDDIDYRAKVAGTVEECAKEVACILSQEDCYFSEFKGAVEGADLQLTKNKLKNILRPELAKLINPAAIRAYAEAATPESFWGHLANLIAAEIHAAACKKPLQCEADCLSWSLLAAFFQVTKFQDAATLGATLRGSLTKGRLNVRGSLLRIVERTNAMGIVDPPLSYIPYVHVALSPAHCAASQLLASVAEQSVMIPAGQGSVIATIGKYITDQQEKIPTESAMNGITPMMVIDSRMFWSPQYEYSALSFSAIAATEFCLRCAAEASPSLGLDCCHAKQMEIVEALPLTAQLKDELGTLFCSTGPNFRNRSLHGGFLEIESRGTETIMHSGIAAEIGVPGLTLNNDPYMPKNAAAVALGVLSRLDAELAPLGLVSPGSTNWTTYFHPNPADLAFAEGLYQPMVKLWLEDTERRAIVGFVQQEFPCLSTPFRLGVIGWATPKPGASKIQLFALLAVMFEPVMRLVAHAAGFPILQRGNSAGIHVTHYLSLNEKGLLAAPFLDWIEAGLSASEKADARNTLRISVRCRDAFVHGAITTFDEPTRKAYGAIMAKSICLLFTSAINHNVLTHKSGRLPIPH